MHRQIFVIAMVAFLAVGHPATLPELTVEGVLTKPRSPIRWEYKAEIKDCSWFINVQSSDNQSFQAGFDGKTIKYLEVLAKGTPDEHIGGSIQEGPVPYQGPRPIIPIIWTALAQGCYLESLSGKAIQACVPEYFKPCSERMELMAGGLPKYIEFVVHAQNDPAHGMPLEDPFKSGFTNSIYRVLSSTNLGKDVVVPLGFELAVFGPQVVEDGGALCKARYVGSVTNILLTVHRSVFQPTIPTGPKIGMADARFGNLESPVYYESTNGYPSDEELGNKPEFKEWAKRSPAFQHKFNIHRGFFFIGFAVITIVVIAVLITTRKRG